MDEFNHDVADTHGEIQALQSLSHVIVYTGDLDMAVTFLSNFHHIKALKSAADIWISFKAAMKTK